MPPLPLALRTLLLARPAGPPAGRERNRNRDRIADTHHKSALDCKGIERSTCLTVTAAAAAAELCFAKLRRFNAQPNARPPPLLFQMIRSGRPRQI